MCVQEVGSSVQQQLKHYQKRVIINEATACKHAFSAAPIAAPPRQPILPRAPCLIPALFAPFSALAASFASFAVDILGRIGLGSCLLAYFLRMSVVSISEICALVSALACTGSQHLRASPSAFVQWGTIGQHSAVRYVQLIHPLYGVTKYHSKRSNLAIHDGPTYDITLRLVTDSVDASY